MEKIQLSKGNKLFLYSLFCVLPLTVSAQTTTYYDAPNNALYLQEVNNGVVANSDTLVLLNMFEEYSFHLEGNKLYISWCTNNFQDKVYYINSYLINENHKIELETQNWIDFRKYPQFKKKGMTLLLNENGLCLVFDSGIVKMIVLSYSELNRNKLSKIASRLSKIIVK